MRELTPKQRAFITEYLVDLNATQAAIRAGYSEHTARSVGAENLTKPDIQEAVAAALREREQRTQVTADYVIKNLVEVVERCMQRAPVLDRRGEHVKDAQGNNVWSFNSKSTVSALGLLGNHLGLFKERHEHSGADGKPLEIVTVTVREQVVEAVPGNRSDG